jgi:hypothetical protein
VAHHVPDSHVNAYMRFKLALTEDEPVIKTYDEALWAELPDARTGSIEPSLELLARLHERWVRLLRAMTPADFARAYRHPDGRGAGDAGADGGAVRRGTGGTTPAQVTMLRQSRGW